MMLMWIDIYVYSSYILPYHLLARIKIDNDNS